MFKDIGTVNNILKEKLSSIKFTNFNHTTVADVTKIFNETSDEVSPQQLILEDIEDFDSAVKIQYTLQGKQFSMIIDKKV
jgi:hypothetical protein